MVNKKVVTPSWKEQQTNPRSRSAKLRVFLEVVMKEQLSRIRPFISVLIFIGALFVIVFFKMEVRRMGYSVLRLSRFEKIEADRRRSRILTYARLVRPDRIEQIAQKQLALSRPQSGQIVQMSGDNIALAQ